MKNSLKSSTLIALFICIFEGTKKTKKKKKAKITNLRKMCSSSMDKTRDKTINGACRASTYKIERCGLGEDCANVRRPHPDELSTEILRDKKKGKATAADSVSRNAIDDFCSIILFLNFKKKGGKKVNLFFIFFLNKKKSRKRIRESEKRENSGRKNGGGVSGSDSSDKDGISNNRPPLKRMKRNCGHALNAKPQNTNGNSSINNNNGNGSGVNHKWMSQYPLLTDVEIREKQELQRKMRNRKSAVASRNNRRLKKEWLTTQLCQAKKKIEQYKTTV
ncbi:hypothetical protein RFI_08374 [Reticulomyxa filosa]|uniref:BZIP domain-containing protein n=1 Tax=Reticulomyxa filosa TaxID=46433 RepID=X6NS40_RETFI|nr:hypothetical protein RFI_08374 [Reticulomyxa filosa]|eukprot:ETO28753.1 hypothetical protein RFI_08374 [Reticulomyxa filosa]